MASKSIRSVDIITTSNPVAAATARATTIGELISTIPQSWRPTLAPYLQTTYRVASKLCTVSNTVAQYERHESTGSFPPFITNALKEPKVQFSKEFLGTAGGTSAGQNLRTAVEKARKDLLAKAIAYKKEELSTLQAAITFDTQEWKSLMRGAMERVAETMGCSIEWPEGKPPIWTGKAGLKELQEESTSLLTNGSTIHYRAVALARSLADKSLIEKTKNLSLKKSTDVEMRDADTEKTTREVVRDELKQEFAQFKQQIAGMIAVRPSSKPFKAWKTVQDYLAQHELLAKLTDKNLGLAVMPLHWYDSQILQMLSDVSTYEQVTSIPTSELVKEMISLLPSWRLPNQLDKYIRTPKKLVLPEFHCIPKVHKEPWALRPIVPSHSWVTTSVSEVLDHLLQPLLERFPWVVASSKDVILQIEKVRTTNTKPVVIATGDVTSFYTNIPPKDCAKVIAGAWKLYMSSSTIPASAIRKMVDFVMVNNYFGYRGTTFRQKMGLAMGTSCAPVLANIYAAYFERKARIVNQDGVLLYVRYIDDILCILQGTKEEQSDFVDRFRLGNLTVRWDSSPVRNEFLDIELLRIPHENHLRVCHTRLFRKPMNRFLYIPWSSAHPLHVKKGFVKAELTRFAILCSRYEFFAEARMEFYGNLRRRGYPVETLRQWFLQIQYDDRARILLPKQKIDNGAPLMLSGHYNPVWDYVDVKEVLDAARSLWTKEELPESLKQPLIRSLGRTTSLFDLLSTWNKTLLLLPSEEGPS
ncbi:hypothetical protein PpBr36_02174 [Pyricularia pennisetigena]|uniref:hypothetical protein n=1 Tax=Pyricularia pennisetigena TaxID=1578925 RepID=UPI001150056C|nr:hypothetical protein PpBr36_02174 [Pyricularia pennisetigena]TLS31200.1 hypothetical protein PpBr36_02174 [Pyricularia pennisetigena]